MGQPVAHDFADWRPGDQRIYLSDVRRLERELGWKAQMGVEDGVRALLGWVTSNDYFQPASSTRA